MYERLRCAPRRGPGATPASAVPRARGRSSSCRRRAPPGARSFWKVLSDTRQKRSIVTRAHAPLQQPLYTRHGVRRRDPQGVLRCVALRCRCRCVALRCVALRCVSLRRVTLHCVASHRVMLCSVVLCYAALCRAATACRCRAGGRSRTRRRPTTSSRASWCAAGRKVPQSLVQPSIQNSIH